MFCFTIANFYKYFYDSNSIYSVFSNIWFVISHSRKYTVTTIYERVSAVSKNDKRYTGLTHLEMFVCYIYGTYFACFVYWIVYCLCITQILFYLYVFWARLLIFKMPEKETVAASRLIYDNSWIRCSYIVLLFSFRGVVIVFIENSRHSG